MNQLSHKFKSRLASTGGGRYRQITFTFGPVAPVIFESIFLIDNGKLYNESMIIHGERINVNVRVSIQKVSKDRFTTRCANGYCPFKWFLDKLNNGLMIEEITPKLDLVRPKYPDISFMENTGNIIIDCNVKFNSPGMPANHWSALV